MKLWIAIYHHRHGTMAFPLWCEDGYTPTEADALTLLDEFEPGERVDIDGPGMRIANAPHFGDATGNREGAPCSCTHGAACHDPATGACLYTNPIHGPCPCAATPPLTRKALRTAHETLRDVLNEQANRR